MDGMELICFQMITNVGNAKSLFIEAVQAAKKGDFERAEELIKEGDKAFIEGHHAHTALLGCENSKMKDNLILLVLHAEDQMMSAETFKILAGEFIDLFHEIKLMKEIK